MSPLSRQSRTVTTPLSIFGGMAEAEAENAGREEARLGAQTRVAVSIVRQAEAALLEPSLTHLEDLVQLAGSRKARRWARAEFFEAAIDVPFYQATPFLDALREANAVPPDGEAPSLPRASWRRLRASLGRPRRFSPAFVAGEKAALEEVRRKGREEGVGPAVGEQATAIHPSTGLPHGGRVLTKEREEGTMRIVFHARDLGVALVPDVDVAGTSGETGPGVEGAEWASQVGRLRRGRWAGRWKKKRKTEVSKLLDLDVDLESASPLVDSIKSLTKAKGKAMAAMKKASEGGDLDAWNAATDSMLALRPDLDAALKAAAELTGPLSVTVRSIISASSLDSLLMDSLLAPADIVKVARLQAKTTLTTDQALPIDLLASYLVLHTLSVLGVSLADACATVGALSSSSDFAEVQDLCTRLVDGMRAEAGSTVLSTMTTTSTTSTTATATAM